MRSGEQHSTGRPIRVGLDARTLERPEDLRGIGVLVSHIVRRLMAEPVELVLFYSRTPDGALPPGRAKQVVLRSWPACLFSPARPARGTIWEQVLLPAALAREPLDLYHAPANRGIPLVGSTRFVVSINDVVPLVTPYFFDSRPDPPLTTWLLRLAYRALLAVAARRAERIITLSHSARRDIERLFPRARGKVRVIYPGADSRYQRVDEAAAIHQIAGRYHLPERYLLYVGGLGQRKNLSGLLRAYALLVARLPDVPALAVVGKHNAFYEPLRRLAGTMGITDRVYFPGFVPTEEMPALMSGAVMLVYPSHYEGFGLPVVEAMACGCPVVCSGTSSLPEVGGDAVVYCDPASPEDIAAKVEQVLTDRALRSDLAERGLGRAREFSMERMTAEVLGVYQDVLSGQRRP